MRVYPLGNLYEMNQRAGHIIQLRINDKLIAFDRLNSSRDFTVDIMF